MNDVLWVLGFIAKNLVQGLIVGAVVSIILWQLFKRRDK